MVYIGEIERRLGVSDRSRKHLIDVKKKQRQRSYRTFSAASSTMCWNIFKTCWWMQLLDRQISSIVGPWIIGALPECFEMFPLVLLKRCNSRIHNCAWWNREQNYPFVKIEWIEFLFSIESSQQHSLDYPPDFRRHLNWYVNQFQVSFRACRPSLTLCNFCLKK